MTANPLTSQQTDQETQLSLSTSEYQETDNKQPTVQPMSIEQAEEEEDCEIEMEVQEQHAPPELKALYAQYFFIGFVYGVLPGTLYGFFMGYLRVDSHVFVTAAQVVALPWSFKFAFGALNDCFPIFGYRRVSYMAIGWTICGVCLGMLANTEMPQPGCKAAAGSFAAKMACAAFGYVMADVAADGLLVQHAKKEPCETRGTIQSTVYLVRTIGSICAALFVGLCMNGREYNGSFTFTLTFSQVCAVTAVPAMIMAPVSWIYIEECRAPTQKLRLYLGECWEVLQTKAMFYVVIYNLCHSIFGSLTTTAGANVSLIWAGVQNLQSQLFSVFGMVIFAGGLALVKKYWLNYSWRKMIAFTTILLGAIDSIFVFCTIFDVVRDQYFYLGEDVLIMVPAAARFMVTSFVVVEMSPEGKEGITYGMLTTLHNLAGPISRAISNQVFGLCFENLSNADMYSKDEPQFREEVAWSYVLSYGSGLCALAFLYFLPDQKQESLERIQQWGSKLIYAKITVCVTFVAWVYAITLNMLVMFPSTSCLKFVGGNGCN